MHHLSYFKRQNLYNENSIFDITGTNKQYFKTKIKRLKEKTTTKKEKKYE